MVYTTLVQVANRIKRHNKYFAYEKSEHCLDILGKMNQYIIENNSCCGMTFRATEYIEYNNAFYIIDKDACINKLFNGAWEYVETHPKVRCTIYK